ncbi:hypothetical protein EYF80_017969 [Liparis tanakae]|uniref:Uncharacterized protein n=1 Tax=Liparis tanakae TaxID=230148 RepID=A0A4Z2I1J3_9TELE|nr:hypothetical protein EYF80_017969 [Liparis tanakae]
MACLDMTSIRALVVSENFDMSTGTGTLYKKLIDYISSVMPTSFLDPVPDRSFPDLTIFEVENSPVAPNACAARPVEAVAYGVTSRLYLTSGEKPDKNSHPGYWYP